MAQIAARHVDIGVDADDDIKRCCADRDDVAHTWHCANFWERTLDKLRRFGRRVNERS